MIDVGSNSTRLFLCEGLDEQGPVGERWTTVTALRRGAAPDGTIAPDAIARLDDCLAGYGRRIRAFSPERTAAVATAALRDAPNRDEVAAVVRRRVGVEPEVVTGEEEARLTFAGARLGVAPGTGTVMVVDVGGASTELVRGDHEPEAAVTLQLGGVRQTEAHLHHDPPLPAEVAALRAEAAALVDRGLRAIGGPASPAIGVAGTVTSLAAIELGRYDRELVHGHRLARAAVEDMAARLCAMSVAQRAVLPGLEPARAPVIAGGAQIVAAVMDVAGLYALTVSERDILDGVAMRLLDTSSSWSRSSRAFP